MESYSEQVKSYIHDNYQLKSASQLSAELADLFSVSISVGGLRTYASKHGLAKQPPYSKMQIQWISENVCRYKNAVEMLADFNRIFNSNRQLAGFRSTIRRVCKDHKFGHSGGLKKGEGKSSTSLPVGSEVFKGGYWWIKINNCTLSSDYSSQDRYKNWVQKHRYIYEKEFGPIPEDCIVIFLDGDVNNCMLDNLYCCPRKYSSYMMRNGWWTDSREHNLAALKLCELMFTLSERC